MQEKPGPIGAGPHVILGEPQARNLGQIELAGLGLLGLYELLSFGSGDDAFEAQQASAERMLERLMALPIRMHSR